MNANVEGKSEHRRFLLVMSAGLVTLLVLAIASLRLGAIPTPFSMIVEDFRRGEGLIWDYRLPRLLCALLVGINLAIAGSILQGVTRNPLAAPDLVGVTAGGGLATTILLLAVPNFNPHFLPFFSFLGSVAVGMCVYVLSYQQGSVRPQHLALTGVAISGGIHSLITLFIVKFAPSATQALAFLKGSLYARTWSHVEMIWPWTVLFGLLAVLFSRQLNVLLLSEESIVGLGMRVERVRLGQTVIAVALAGSAVAIAGTIGFIGLIIPHLTRLLVGTNYRYVLPASALLGALFVIAADTVGRSVTPPMEIPAGIITAMLGAPYFVYLLVKRKTAF
jgi:ABC-type Fe3+-siderophore transport system permease subunit